MSLLDGWQEESPTLQRARLRYLLRLSPQLLVKEIAQNDFAALFEKYINAAEQAHARFSETVLAEGPVRAALEYDYEEAINAMQASAFSLPQQMMMSDIIELTGTVQAHRDYIDAFYRIASRNVIALQAAWDAIVADWQSLAVTDTEMQAKAQAQGLHPDVRFMLAKAERMKTECHRLFDRLQNQYFTLRSLHEMSRANRESGDFAIPTQAYRRAQRGEDHAASTD